MVRHRKNGGLERPGPEESELTAQEGDDVGFARKIRRRVLLPGSLTRGAATLAGGTAVAGAILALASPLLSRLYSPADFGRVGAVAAFTSFASVALSLKYDVAIVSAKGTKEAAYLALISSFVIVPMSALSAALLWALTERSALGFGVLRGLSPVVIATAVAAIAAAQMVGRYWLIRGGQFGIISTTTVAQNGIRLVVQLTFAVLGVGWIGMVWGELLGRTGALALIVRAAWPALGRELRAANVREVLGVARDFRAFPLYTLPSTLIDVVALNLPLPLILRFYGAEAAGHFALVQMLLAIPLALVAGSVADAFHNRLSECARSSPRDAWLLFWRTAKALLLVALLAGAATTLVGRFGFQFLFGQPWATAGMLTAAMAPWVVGQIAVSPLSRALLVFQALRLKLLRDATALIAVAASLTLSHRAGFTLAQAVHVLSITQLGLYTVYFCLLAWVVKGRM